jgi:hypothetical protein
MTAFFADSPGLRMRQRRALLESGDYAASLAKEAGAEARVDYYERLAKYLSGRASPTIMP